jgi:hypothetical protein
MSHWSEPLLRALKSRIFSHVVATACSPMRQHGVNGKEHPIKPRSGDSNSNIAFRYRRFAANNPLFSFSLGLRPRLCATIASRFLKSATSKLARRASVEFSRWDTCFERSTPTCSSEAMPSPPPKRNASTDRFVNLRPDQSDRESKLKSHSQPSSTSVKRETNSIHKKDSVLAFTSARLKRMILCAFDAMMLPQPLASADDGFAQRASLVATLGIVVGELQERLMCDSTTKFPAHFT